MTPDPTLLKSVLGSCEERGGYQFGRYSDLSVASAFQPIVSVSHRRVVGYEALMRPQRLGGAEVDPLVTLSRARTAGEESLLDHLALTVHMRNFITHGPDPGWLFVNVQPDTFMRGAVELDAHPTLADRLGLHPSRIVIEVLETMTTGEDRIAESIERFQRHGFLVAIDDFGIGRSNFDRVWGIQPDIVKLDRLLTHRAGRTRHDRRMARIMVNMLHQMGAMVVAEGVETTEQALALMDADVDFMQGFLFARPGVSPAIGSRAISARINELWHAYQNQVSHPDQTVRAALQMARRQLSHAAELYMNGSAIADVAAHLFGLPGMLRLFILDGDGEQQGASMRNPDTGATEDPRLLPLFPDEGANLSRRPYFRDALRYPSRVAVFGPHFSLSAGPNCYTAGVLVERAGQSRVVCADFRLPDRIAPV